MIRSGISGFSRKVSELQFADRVEIGLQSSQSIDWRRWSLAYDLRDEFRIISQFMRLPIVQSKLEKV